MNQKYGFWKSQWGKPFIILLSVFLGLTFIFAIIFSYLTITPEGLSIDYLPIFYLPILIIIWLVFQLGLVCALVFPHIIKPLSGIFELNNVGYSDKKSKLHFLYLIFVVIFFLLTIFVYFFSLKYYEPIKTLLLSWTVLIFIRSAHYVNKDIGEKIGIIIVSFFLPFGLFIGGITLFESWNIIISNSFQTGLFLLYILIIVSAHLPLEVLMEYVSQQYNKKDNNDNNDNQTRIESNKVERMSKSKNYLPIIILSLFFIVSICILLYIAIKPEMGISKDILIILMTAIISGYGWIIKNEFDKRREIDRRDYESEREYERLTFETRRQSYERLMQPFIDVFSSMGGGTQINQANLGTQMQQAGIKLHIYGSDEVIHAFNSFRAIAIDIENVKEKIQNAPQGRGNQKALQDLQSKLDGLNLRLIVGWANLIITIRKSTGFPESSLTIEEFLRGFIKDFNAHAVVFRKEIKSFKQE